MNLVSFFPFYSQYFLLEIINILCIKVTLIVSTQQSMNELLVMSFSNVYTSIFQAHKENKHNTNSVHIKCFYIHRWIPDVDME